MRAVFATMLCACAFVGLCYVTVNTISPKIADHIVFDISQQLARHQITAIDITVDGRDVTLHGELKDQQQINHAMKIASHRPGVRIVMNNMRVSTE